MSVVQFPGTRHQLVQIKTQGSGGGGGDGMDARIAKLESDVGHIQSDIADIKDDVREIKTEARGDFRLLFGALIAVALGLAALMAKGFGWV